MCRLSIHLQNEETNKRLLKRMKKNFREIVDFDGYTPFIKGEIMVYTELE